MRLKPTLTTAALLALAALSHADAKAEIEAVYKKLDTAIRAKDLKGVLSHFTSDFKWINAKGQASNKAQLESQMKMQLTMLQKVIQISNKITKFTVKGSTVVTTTDGVFEADLKFTPDAKKNSRLKSLSKTEDVWVKSPKGWQLKQVKTLKETMTLDGKPFSG